jgi:hypothetical protein
MFILKTRLSPFLPSDMIEGGLCPLGQPNTQKSIWLDFASLDAYSGALGYRPHAVACFCRGDFFGSPPRGSRLAPHALSPFSPVAGRRMGTGSQWAQRCPVFFTRRGNHIRRLLHRLRGKTGNPVSGTFLRVAPDPTM